jgi:hypothetical protein
VEICGGGIAMNMTATEAMNNEKRKWKMNSDLQWAKQNDPFVHAVIESGGTEAECIVELVKSKKELIEKLMLLESIAPRRILVGGKEYVYRCPDNLIPGVEFPFEVENKIRE